MSDLPWSEDYMLRMSHPMYNAFCREDEEPCEDDGYIDDSWYEELTTEERNNLMEGDK